VANARGSATAYACGRKRKGCVGNRASVGGLVPGSRTGGYWGLAGCSVARWQMLAGEPPGAPEPHRRHSPTTGQPSPLQRARRATGEGLSLTTTYLYGAGSSLAGAPQPKMLGQQPGGADSEIGTTKTAAPCH